MIEVQAPNGDVVRFPDGTSDDVITSAMRKEYGGPQEPKAPVGVVEDMARSVPTGLVKGVTGMAGLPGAARELGETGARYLLNKFADAIEGMTGKTLTPEQRTGLFDQAMRDNPRTFPTPAELNKGVESVVGPLHEPQTRAGRYVETAAEFVPGAGRKLITMAALPGVASEAAGEATRGTAWEAPARVGAAVLTGGAGAVASRPSTPERAIRNAMPEATNPAIVAQAEQLIQQAAQRGIQLTWSEALSQVSGRPVLSDMTRILESAPGSRTVMQDFYAGRPQQVTAAMRSGLDAVAPQPANPSGIGSAVGQAAEGVVSDVRGIINRAAEPYYTAAAGTRLTPQEMAQVRALPGYAEARDVIRNTPQLNRYVAHLPEDSVGFLNEVKKQLDASKSGASSPLATNPNMQIPAGYGRDAEAVRNIGVNASPAYEVALNIESQAREKYLKPLLEGPLGRMAEKDLSTQKAIKALFPDQPIPNSDLEISTAVSALAKRNPPATRQLVRSYLESQFENAINAMGRNPETAQFAGAEAARRIAGSPIIETAKSQNVRAAIEASSGKTVADGFDRFLEVLQATGTRQPVGSRTAFNAQDLSNMSSGSAIGNLAKTGAAPGKWLTIMSDAWSRWQLGSNLNQLAAIVTDPHAASMLKTISTRPVDSRDAILLGGRLANMGLQTYTNKGDQSQRP